MKQVFQSYRDDTLRVEPAIASLLEYENTTLATFCLERAAMDERSVPVAYGNAAPAATEVATDCAGVDHEDQ